MGDFEPAKEGLEVFCRSACGQAPWVFGADGALIASWVVNETKPEGWYIDGIEEVCRIDWDGDPRQEIVLKERHVDEAAAIVDPLTGEFKQVFDGEAVRVYAADISGDHREEVITVDLSGEIRVFWNDESNDNIGALLGTAALPAPETELELLFTLGMAVELQS